MNIKEALLHNTGWRIIVMVFTFVNNIIIVRLLGAETSAIFFYALAIFALLGSVFRFGLESGIIYVTSKQPRYTGAVAVLILVVVVIQTAVTVVVLKNFISEARPFSLFWAAVYVMDNILILYVSAFFQVKKRFISLNISAAVFVLLQTVLIILFYKRGAGLIVRQGWAMDTGDAVLAVISGCILLQILFLIIYLFIAEKPDFTRFVFRRQTITSLARFSIVNFIAGVILFLITRADLYFVERYCTALVLANYIQVAKIGQLMLVIPGQISGVIFPYAVNAKESFDNKIGFFGRICTAAFIFIYVLFFIFGNFGFTLLFGKDFSYAYPAMACIFPGFYFLALHLIIISYYEGKNLQKIIVYAELITLLIILAGDFFLVPIGGYIAAAIVFSAANLAGLCISLFYFKRLTSVKLKDFFYTRKSDIAALLRRS